MSWWIQEDSDRSDDAILRTSEAIMMSLIETTACSPYGTLCCQCHLRILELDTMWHNDKRNLLLQKVTAVRTNSNFLEILILRTL